MVDMDVALSGPRFSKEAVSRLSPSDQQLFEHFGTGPRVLPPFGCIHHAFEAWAAARPKALAAQHLNQAITYGALERQANRLAARLARHGVSPGDTVALFLQRSIPMLVGMLGALKVGAAYVPQSVGIAPEAQLRHIVEVTSARVILTLSRLRHLVPVPDGHLCIAIDEVMEEPDDAGASGVTAVRPAAESGPDSLCFILFTSGTTGTPNGVQVTHRNVCNILLTQPGSLGMRPGIKVAQILNIAFDMAAWEILGCLAHGATLVIRGKDLEQAARQAQIVIATPTILGSFDASRCRNVEVAAVAGEPCPRPLADEWAAFCRFYNCCGPTETTIVNTAQLHHPERARLTIGKPTPNNTVYVLDKDRRPCPIGAVGEMWAGGDCVSAGYLADERLTRERYAPDPFLGGGRRMFRTRDLGRWTPDGELEHLGRVDDQVKVRGFRIELDSVSSVLETVPSCLQAVTLKRDNRSLVAFVRPAGVNLEAARRAVASALPYYCMPALILAMDRFPLTSRGKVDKQRLLRLAEQHRGARQRSDEQRREAQGRRQQARQVAQV